MGGISDGGGCKIIVLNDEGNKAELSEDDISQFLRTKLAGVRKELIEFFKERSITVGFGINILDIDEGALFFTVKQSIRNHNKAKLESVVNDQRNAYSKTVNKNFALAKELGVELAQFDHLEWNKLALEISRKEREIGAKDSTEVDPRRHNYAVSKFQA